MPDATLHRPAALPALAPDARPSSTRSPARACGSTSRSLLTLAPGLGGLVVVAAARATIGRGRAGAASRCASAARVGIALVSARRPVRGRRCSCRDRWRRCDTAGPRSRRDRLPRAHQALARRAVELGGRGRARRGTERPASTSRTSAITAPSRARAKGGRTTRRSSGDGDAPAPGDRGRVAGRAHQHPRRRPHVPRHPHAPLRDIDDARRCALASLVPGNEPVLIETIPGNLSQVVPAQRARHGGRARDRARRRRTARARAGDGGERARIIDTRRQRQPRARRRQRPSRLGTHRDRRGRCMHPAGLARRAARGAVDARSRRSCARAGAASTKVVERYVADTDDGLALPFTVPLVAWGMFRTLSVRRARRLVRVDRGALLLLARVQRDAPAPLG